MRIFLLVLLFWVMLFYESKDDKKIYLSNKSTDRCVDTNAQYCYDNYYETGVRLKSDGSDNNSSYKLWYFPEEKECEYCIITYQDGLSKRINKYEAIDYKNKSVGRDDNLVEVLIVTSYDSNNIPKCFSKVNIYWDEDQKRYYSSSIG